jgi:DNA-directed RNA polymerase beta' subunit
MKSINPKLIKIESIRIGLASPEHIKKWAERTLPNGKTIGQVTSSQTVNYKTLKPEKGGLFCERVFGPVKDFECACGKKKTRPQQKYCSECDVEFTSSRIRRYRLGFIQLISPVAHVWYLKGRPSYISILLDIPKKKADALTYCTDITRILNSYKENQSFSSYGTFYPSQRKLKTFYCFSSNSISWDCPDDWTFFSISLSLRETLDRPIKVYFQKKENNFFSTIPQIGAKTLQHFLEKLDFHLIEREIRIQLFYLEEDLYSIKSELLLLDQEIRKNYPSEDKETNRLKKFLSRQKKLLLYSRARKNRRLKLIRQFRRTEVRPEWMILSILPVLSPDLRPIIQLDGDQVAISDLNKLYQKVLFRNTRNIRIQKDPWTSIDEMRYAQRLLQEAVDALIENGKGGADPLCGLNDRPLKSLSDMLKGKKGRFRQNLLGKRVDYSGRSVIVVGPNLKLHECGLPKELAIELFQPFLIRRLISKKLIRTIVGAKRLIQQQNPIIWKVLAEVLQYHPVLLNRAPTLHRVGFQAFQPKLVDGRAILLHPLVCTAFNADFDGDQMAVHLPLSFEARAEAWILMWSRNNILSPATGQPLLVPSQDMVLGCYYLTTSNSDLKSPLLPHFQTYMEVLKYYQSKDCREFSFYNRINEKITTHPQESTFDEIQNKKIQKLNICTNHTPIWVAWKRPFESTKEKQQPLEIQVQTQGSSLEIYFDYRPCNYQLHEATIMYNTFSQT